MSMTPWFWLMVFGALVFALRGSVSLSAAAEALGHDPSRLVAVGGAVESCYRGADYAVSHDAEAVQWYQRTLMLNLRHHWYVIT